MNRSYTFHGTPESLDARAEFDKLVDKLDEEELSIASQYLANLILSRVPPIPTLPPNGQIRKGGGR